jgi:hypothetical protein
METPKTWTVFYRDETAVRVVLRDVTEADGYRPVFGPESFEACMAWINRSGASPPTSNSHQVFQNEVTGTLMVLRNTGTPHAGFPKYGPDTFANCLQWVRANGKSRPL